MPEQHVLIRHPDGREYSIDPADFTNPSVSRDGRFYAAQGFVIVSYANGQPYDGPKMLQEVEQAEKPRRAERPASRKGRSKRSAVIAAVAIVLALPLATVGVTGAKALDERYLHSRFVPARQDRQCPLALHRNEATPMCTAMPGW